MQKLLVCTLITLFTLPAFAVSRKVEKTGQVYVRALVEFAKSEIRRNDIGRISDQNLDKVFCKKIEDIVDLDVTSAKILTRSRWNKLKQDAEATTRFKKKLAKWFVENFQGIFTARTALNGVDVTENSARRTIIATASIRTIGTDVTVRYFLKYNRAAFNKVSLTDLSLINRYLNGDKTYRGINLKSFFPKGLRKLSKAVKIDEMVVNSTKVSGILKDALYTKYLRKNRKASLDDLVGVIAKSTKSGGLGISGTCP